MKICITSEGKDLDSKVDPRFGRCRNFIFFDTDSGNFEAQENTNAQFQGGAGIQSGQLVVSKGVEVVLTGNVGPNAHIFLKPRIGGEKKANILSRIADSISNCRNQNTHHTGNRIKTLFLSGKMEIYS